MPTRRQVLAALPPFLAGCTSAPSVNRPTKTATPTPPEMIDDCRPIPDPPADPTPAETREFVAAYEEAMVYNWLVAQNDGPDECRPDGPGSSGSAAGVASATNIDIESARTSIVTEADSGYYLLSSCSGTAEYWCPDEGRVCSNAGRNAHFVTHFVGDERHVRIPHNWFVCHVSDDPYRGPDASDNVSVSADEPGMTFRVYSFHEDATVDVTLTALETDEQVIENTYSPNVGPAVQRNATVATGEYELVAETPDERRVYEFSLTGRDDSAWNGLCVYVGPDDLHVVEVATTGTLAVPESPCHAHRTGSTDSDSSAS